MQARGSDVGAGVRWVVGCAGERRRLEGFVQRASGVGRSKWGIEDEEDNCVVRDSREDK
jgi:hypothetical protein